MGGSETELGLNLSLGYGETWPSLRPNHMQKPSHPLQNHHIRSSGNDLFQFSGESAWRASVGKGRNAETASLLAGIDVNQTPTAVDREEENGVSSPNSTISSLSGKRCEREAVGDETEAERASCSRGSDDEDGGGGDMSRKKLRLSKEQSLVLEETFKEHNTLNPKQKLALARQLNLRPRQVEVWFQNRRARTKLKQTEVDCEYLKKCCENLTEENRRLRKEVQELRALKLSPSLYMHLKPPTTLTMCPQCERVAVSSSSSPTGGAASAAAPTAVTRRNPARPSIDRPIPINFWATVPDQR